MSPPQDEARLPTGVDSVRIPIMKLIRALCLAMPVILAACEEKSKAAGDPNYPLKVCVVSGEKLGSMGAPYIHKHDGKEVQLCCKGCLKDFNKDPEKYLAKIAAAKAKP
jgi:YHS domain-containing protein